MLFEDRNENKIEITKSASCMKILREFAKFKIMLINNANKWYIYIERE